MAGRLIGWLADSWFCGPKQCHSWLRVRCYAVWITSVVLRINSSKSLSSLEDEGRRFLRNVVIRLPPAATGCSRRTKSKTCRWKEIFVSRLIVALKPLFFIFLPRPFVLLVLVILHCFFSLFVSLYLSPSFSSPPPPPLSSPFRSSSSLSLYMFSSNLPRTGWKVGPRNVRFASFVLCMRQNWGPNFLYWNSLSLPAEWGECCCGRTT